MKLLHKQTSYTIENDTSAIHFIYEKVNELIQQENTVFSHLVIDNQEIYEEHEAYISKHLQEILQVEIVTHSKQEMIWETMDSINDYLKRAIPALKELIDASYHTFTKQTWEGIDQLAEGMQWILQFNMFTKASKIKPAYWENIEESISTCEQGFKALMEGIETKDTVLISDILSYEIVPAYESLESNLEKSLEDRELCKNAN